MKMIMIVAYKASRSEKERLHGAQEMVFLQLRISSLIHVSSLWQDIEAIIIFRSEKSI